MPETLKTFEVQNFQNIRNSTLPKLSEHKTLKTFGAQNSRSSKFETPEAQSSKLSIIGNDTLAHMERRSRPLPSTCERWKGTRSTRNSTPNGFFTLFTLQSHVPTHYCLRLPPTCVRELTLTPRFAGALRLL